MDTEKQIVSYIPVYNGVYIQERGWKTEFIETFQIAEAFEKYGGSFIQKIGWALHHADPINTLKVFTTWEEEVKVFISQFIKNGNN